MQSTITNLRFAAVVSVCFALAPLLVAKGVAQTAPPDPEANAATDKELKAAEDDLYILKDVAKPAEEEPKLDLGKVGKKGELTLERMPVEPPGTYEGEPEPRRGAGGVRLKIPLGKQE